LEFFLGFTKRHISLPRPEPLPLKMFTGLCAPFIFAGFVIIFRDRLQGAGKKRPGSNQG